MWERWNGFENLKQWSQATWVWILDLPPASTTTLGCYLIFLCFSIFLWKIGLIIVPVSRVLVRIKSKLCSTQMFAQSKLCINVCNYYTFSSSWVVCVFCHKDIQTKSITSSEKQLSGLVQITLNNCYENKIKVEILVIICSKSTISLSVFCLFLVHMKILVYVASIVLHEWLTSRSVFFI